MIFFKRKINFAFLGKKNVLFTTPFKQKEVYFNDEDNGKCFDLIKLKFVTRSADSVFFARVDTGDKSEAVELYIYAKLDTEKHQLIETITFSPKEKDFSITARIYEEA